MPTKRLRRRSVSPKALLPGQNKKQVRFLALQPHHPPVSVADLAQMLEIDLLLGRRGDFHRRLQKALETAASGTSSVKNKN